MAVTVKYVVGNISGSYVDWADRVSGYGPVSSGEIQVTGGIGNDTVYLQAGTSANLVDLRAGDDSIYLTGNLVDYSQSIDPGTGVYTLTRTAGLSGGQVEIVKFTVGDENDVLYFADGHVVLNTSNPTLFDGSAFTAISTLDAGGSDAGPVTTTPIAVPAAPDKVFLTASAGVAVPLQQQPGQSQKVIGSGGADSVYVKAGTSMDASDMRAGADKIYLTGNLTDYSQSIDQDTGVYTLTRTAGLPVGQTEVVKFVASDEDDVVYFADGSFVLNIMTNEAVFDGTNYLVLAYPNPKVTSATDPASNQTVLAGGTLDVAVNFDRAVVLADGKTVTVVAQIDKADGSGRLDVTLTATGDATTAAVAGVTTLHFTAAPATGLADTDGIVLKADSLALGTATAAEFAAAGTAAAVSTTFVAVPLAHQLVDTAAPAFTSGATASVAENQNALYTAVASDTVSYSLSGTDAGSLSIDSSTGAITLASGNLDYETKNSYAFSVTATDANGNTTAQAVTVSVTNVNEAPTLDNALADQTAVENTTVSFIFPSNSFSDVDGDTLAYTATLADGSALPSWLNFNSTNRSFSGTPLTADVGTINVKVTASDGSLTANDTFALVVKQPAHIVKVVSDAPDVNAVSTVNVTDTGNFVTFTVTFSRELANAATALTGDNFALVQSDGMTLYSTADNYFDVALDTADTTNLSYTVSAFVGELIDADAVKLKFIADTGSGAVKDIDNIDTVDHLALADETVSATAVFTQNVDTDAPQTDAITFTGTTLTDGKVSDSEDNGSASFTLSHATDASKVEIYANDGTTLLDTADAVGAWGVTIDLSTLNPNLDITTGEGSYEFVLKQTDDDGNVETGTYTMNFDTKAIDALITSNVPATIGNADYTGPSGSEVFTLSGSAQEAGTVTVNWDLDNNGSFELTQTASVTTAGPSAWSVDFAKAYLQANAGNGAFKVSFADIYGNATLITHSIQADIVI